MQYTKKEGKKPEEVWVREVAVCGLLTAAAGEPGLKFESEPPGRRSGQHRGWIHVPETKKHFLRFRASWALPVMWEPMTNTLWVIAYSLSRVWAQAEPWQLWIHLYPRPLQHEQSVSGCDLPLQECSPAAAKYKLLRAGDSTIDSRESFSILRISFMF